MAQLLIRNLPDTAKDKLRAMAVHHKRSLESEARMILQMAAEAPQSIPTESLGEWLAAQFAGIGLTPSEIGQMETLRSTPLRYATFNEE